MTEQTKKELDILDGRTADGIGRDRATDPGASLIQAERAAEAGLPLAAFVLRKLAEAGSCARCRERLRVWHWVQATLRITNCCRECLDQWRAARGHPEQLKAAQADLKSAISYQDFPYVSPDIEAGERDEPGNLCGRRGDTTSGSK